MAERSSPSMQLEFFEIPSPCIGVCESGPKGFCKGCFRSRDERLYWLKVDDATKRQIINVCVKRKRAFLARQRRENMQQPKQDSQQFDFFEGE
tara:strand:- start:1384 stop:1662 length:279 start_codon:yes stop_codon:yes gene_type:complete